MLVRRRDCDCLLLAWLAASGGLARHRLPDTSAPFIPPPRSSSPRHRPPPPAVPSPHPPAIHTPLPPLRRPPTPLPAFCLPYSLPQPRSHTHTAIYITYCLAVPPTPPRSVSLPLHATALQSAPFVVLVPVPLRLSRLVTPTICRPRRSHDPTSPSRARSSLLVAATVRPLCRIGDPASLSALRSTLLVGATVCPPCPAFRIGRVSVGRGALCPASYRATMHPLIRNPVGRPFLSRRRSRPVPPLCLRRSRGAIVTHTVAPPVSVGRSRIYPPLSLSTRLRGAGAPSPA